MWPLPVWRPPCGPSVPGAALLWEGQKGRKPSPENSNLPGGTAAPVAGERPLPPPRVRKDVTVPGPFLNSAKGR